MLLSFPVANRLPSETHRFTSTFVEFPRFFSPVGLRTSFPPFVEELAMELFSTENSNALPFPIQAQAWPCALAGFDVIAVAPTGAEGGRGGIYNMGVKKWWLNGD